MSALLLILIFLFGGGYKSIYYVSFVFGFSFCIMFVLRDFLDALWVGIRT